jgi:hypothetical protein
MTRSLSIFVASITVLLTMTACATAPGSAVGNSDPRRNSDLVLAKAQRNDPSLAKTFRDAAGYAVFATVGKDATPVGGSTAAGALYEYGTFVGLCNLTQAPTGSELGGRVYVEIIVFQTEQAVYDFKSGRLAFDARTAAETLKSSSGANIQYVNGVAVLTIDDAGRSYEAWVGGQQFNRQAPRLDDWTNAVTQLDGL